MENLQNKLTEKAEQMRQAINTLLNIMEELEDLQKYYYTTLAYNHTVQLTPAFTKEYNKIAESFYHMEKYLASLVNRRHTMANLIQKRSERIGPINWETIEG